MRMHGEPRYKCSVFAGEVGLKPGQEDLLDQGLFEGTEKSVPDL